jgi:hypothetical protein
MAAVEEGRGVTYRAREPKSRARRYLSRLVCRAHTIVHSAPVITKLRKAFTASNEAQKASCKLVRIDITTLLWKTYSIDALVANGLPTVRRIALNGQGDD